MDILEQCDSLIRVDRDTCPDDACVGIADGWGERAGAAALTVGLIFCRLFDQAKSRKKTLRARATPTVGADGLEKCEKESILS